MYLNYVKCWLPLTNAEKVNAVDEVTKSGKSKNKNVKQFNIPSSTLSNVLQNKNDILHKYGNNKKTMEIMKISEYPAI